MRKKKKVVVLGSAGSIGTQTLDVIRRLPERFAVIALAGKKLNPVFEKQMREFCPAYFHLASEEGGEEPQRMFPGSSPRTLESLASLPEADIIVNAVSGSAGLLPTLAAIRAGKTLALANKECLVMAGDIVMNAARRTGASVIPVDSEHSAIFQALACGRKKEVRRLILTCSGGPFLGKTKEYLTSVTPKDALKHPSWTMGTKISIDSATLMNKGLEVIEAHHLFGMPYDRIGVVIHPQSIVHSLVEFVDGSVIAQLAAPDMRIPILNALSYPERLDAGLPRIDLASIGVFEFRTPDTDVFPCLELAKRAGEIGGAMPCVLNAANEIAVQAFLDGEIVFYDVSRAVSFAMQNQAPVKKPKLPDILAADKQARELVSALLRRIGARHAASKQT